MLRPLPLLVMLPWAAATSGATCPSLLQRGAALTPTHSNFAELEESLGGSAKCADFAEQCGVDPSVIDGLESWEEAEASFELCCLAGKHKDILCRTLAEESFMDKSGTFSPDDNFCDEMINLMKAHKDWARDPALRFSSHVATHLEQVLTRVRELHAVVPRLIERGFRAVGSAGGMAGLALGAHARSSQVLLAATVTMIATTIEKCDRDTWADLCKNVCDGPIDMSKRVWKDDPDTGNGCCKPDAASEEFTWPVDDPDGTIAAARVRVMAAERGDGFA